MKDKGENMKEKKKYEKPMLIKVDTVTDLKGLTLDCGKSSDAGSGNV